MIDFLQQLFGGIALGCVYGLIALGFVLIYKATEVVNFAQGEVMMIGAFLSYTFISTLGLNYWIGFAMCIACMAIIGSLIERLVVRPILGYPQFSIVMATIGLGLVLRALAGIIWGSKLGVQFSLSLVALKALPVVILGGLTSVPGAIIGGLIIGVGEKLSEVYLGPYVGGGIEIWFAYVLALGFLLFRPQGLFGEKISDRV